MIITGTLTLNWLLALLSFLFLLKLKNQRARLFFVILFPLLVVFSDWWALRTDWEHVLAYPFSDASGYLSYGLGLAENFVIGTWGGRRPLYSTFLSSLFTLTGPNLLPLLLLQALLQGICMGLLDRAFLHRFDRSVAAFSFFVIAVFSVRFYGNTLTENLGLPLGVLSLYFLVSGERMTLSRGMWSVFFLSFGMLSRAGAFFSIPALMLILWHHLRADRSILSRDSVKIAVTLAMSAVIPYAFLKAVSAFLVVSGALTFSNFSYTLYGLVRGGHAWTHAMSVHPHLAQESSDVVRSKMIYALALESLRTEPWLAIVGVFNSIKDFIRPSIISAYGFMGSGAPKFLARVPVILFTLIAVAGVFHVFRAKNQKAYSIYRALLIGTLLSVPFVQPIDADSMRAYAVSIPLVALLAGLGWIQVRVWYSRSEINVGSAIQSSSTLRPALLIGGVYVLLTLAPLLRMNSLREKIPDRFGKFGTGYAFAVVEQGRSITFTSYVDETVRRFGYPGGEEIGNCLSKVTTARLAVGKTDFDNLTYLLIADDSNWSKIKNGQIVELRPVIRGSPLQVYTDDSRCY